ncbi:hypothetical protein DSC_07275 [Pseudoxanthomonas spadix BD-a59]|uniref:Uncharacterized protein n=1 Tax=Pseudoxanthomonas spadix (strain BD-a59) TaxID=1045855 RepID=G7UT41_PSEUP|nr:hypothetical protein [Pseudoxanthomonas spadix]AER56106.1 hypothetical protein DSC_07275 [Pseudoxanthomonas spadix BD-a59]
MGKYVNRNNSFHEWLADNIARALEGKRETQSVVGMFFADIAEKLRKLYAAIAGDPKLAKYKPAPTVEAWVNDLFDGNIAAVRQVTGITGTKAGAESEHRPFARGRRIEPTTCAPEESWWHPARVRSEHGGVRRADALQPRVPHPGCARHHRPWA